MITRLEFQCSGEIRTQFFITIERLKKKTQARTCLGPVVANYEKSMPGFRTITRIARRRYCDVSGFTLNSFIFFLPTSRCGYGRTPGSEWMNGGGEIKNKIKSFRSIMLHRYPREQLVSSRHCSRRARAIINYRTRRWQYILPTDGSRPHNIMCLNCLKNSLPRQWDSSVVTVTWSRRTIGASRAAFEFETPSNTG